MANKCDRCGGMSLRDWFAGQALAGYMAQPDGRSLPSGRDVTEWRNEIVAQDAAYCYLLADAMLKTRAT